MDKDMAAYVRQIAIYAVIIVAVIVLWVYRDHLSGFAHTMLQL